MLRRTQPKTTVLTPPAMPSKQQNGSILWYYPLQSAVSASSWLFVRVCKQGAPRAAATCVLLPPLLLLVCVMLPPRRCRC
eukprot:6193481-Pleurochrysis_carterae.AAC.4